MYILIYAPHRKGDSAWFIAKNLKSLGHKTEVFNFIHNQLQDNLLSRARYKLPFLGQIFIRDSNSKIVSLSLKKNPDLVIICKGQYILPETIRRIRKKGIKIINWYPDGITEITKSFIMQSIKEYDYFFTKEPYLMKRLSASGLNNIHYLPHCCDPEIHRTIELSKQDKEKYASTLSMVGSWYPYREAIISQLSGYDLKIWGKGWQKAIPELGKAWQKKEAVGREQALVFNATDININTSHPQDIEGVNKRVFDIAGCGAFQLCYKEGDLDNLFKPQEEIIAYKNIDELKELVEYYLRHEKERREIARNSQKRAYREHTYKQRIEYILGLIR